MMLKAIALLGLCSFGLTLGGETVESASNNVTFNRVKKNGLLPHIILGLPAKNGVFPWHVTVLSKNGFTRNRCGGALISTTAVLTAAHCVKGTESALLGFGGIQFDYPLVKIVVPSDNYRIHPEYVSSMNDIRNDIALIKINGARSFKFFPKFITPVALVTKGYTVQKLSKLQAYVSGYGMQSDDDAGSKYMEFARVQIVDNQMCDRIFIATPKTLCVAGYLNPLRNICGGDSGGPLVVFDQKKIMLVGIVSFGATSCLTGAPNVFTRVELFLDWIAKNS